jgi:hypothetical protein
MADCDREEHNEGHDRSKRFLPSKAAMHHDATGVDGDGVPEKLEVTVAMDVDQETLLARC